MSCADGSWTLAGLAPDTHTVCVRAPTDPVVTRAGQLRRDDLVLQPAGGVSGMVTDASGAPVADALVVAYTPGQIGSSAYDRTDAHGAYQITGLAAGTYDVCFRQPYSFEDVQCWQAKAPDQDPTPVAVTPGAFTTGIDAVLPADDAAFGRAHAVGQGA